MHLVGRFPLASERLSRKISVSYVFAKDKVVKSTSLSSGNDKTVTVRSLCY